MEVIKGDTRSLDYSSYRYNVPQSFILMAQVPELSCAGIVLSIPKCPHSTCQSSRTRVITGAPDPIAFGSLG